MTKLLNIHENIREKLDFFHKMHRIPNIIFHGASGSGKSTIVNEFINKIYDGNKEKIKDFVMHVNCAHGKGIKFIRDELKFFAKSHINSNGGDIFKCIVLLNGDKLTMDAQSALRRCIELFSHTTRFFIILEDKYKLLKPILSRFCEIYIPEPLYNGVPINLYKYNIENTFKLKDFKKKKTDRLKNELNKSIHKDINTISLLNISSKLYEKGYSGLDLIQLLEDNTNFTHLDFMKRYELLIAFNRVGKVIRNEKILIHFILHFIFIDTSETLKNISFM
jgi:DNA polymerase III delta prime subunit